MTNPNQLPGLPFHDDEPTKIFVLKIVGANITDAERVNGDFLDYYHEEDRDLAEEDANAIGCEIVRDLMTPTSVRVIETTKGLPAYDRDMTYTDIGDALRWARDRARELGLSRRVPQFSYTLVCYSDAATKIEVIA